MSKLVEETIKRINANKEIFTTLPRNNVKNINIYMEKLNELKEEFTGYEKDILKEMEKRFHEVNDIAANQDIAVLEQELEKIKDGLYLLNNVNTSFEKMDFDETTYELRYYYKKNLEVISDSILRCIKKFEDVGVDLKLTDFHYSKYVREYLTVFFEELDKTEVDYTKIKS